VELKLWRYQSALATALRASGQEHLFRDHLLLEISADGVSGFGEVSPQPSPLNGDSSAGQVVTELLDFALPQLSHVHQRESALPVWPRINRFAGSRPGSVVAYSLIEMALFDLELRRARTPAGDALGAVSKPQLQAVGSLVGDIHIPRLTDIARIRLKVDATSTSPTALEAVRAVDVPVLLDFNCLAPSVDDVLSTVRSLASACTVVGVEQPFAPGNLIQHAQLAEQLDVPVSLDEGVRGLRDIDNIERYKAAQVVCLKPARLGGIAMTRAALARCTEAGIEPYIGGFFELPLARTLNYLLASSPTVGPSDVTPVTLSNVGSGLFRTDECGIGLTLDSHNQPGLELITSL